MKDDEIELVIQKLRGSASPAWPTSSAPCSTRAARDNLSALQVVDRLCDEEKASRLRNAVDRRIRDARFPEINTVDAFNFDFDPVRKKAARPLPRSARPRLHREGHQPPLHRRPRHRQDLPGPRARLPRLPGQPARRLRLARRACSTTFTAPSCTAASIAPCAATCAPNCSSSTTSPFSRWTRPQAKLAFQVISERYDYRRSTVITTNRPFKDWTKVFPDALNAQVIAERLTERAEHFVMDGKGYRQHVST